MIKLLFFWFSFVVILPSSVSVYPWDDSLQERSFEILNQLRENLQLDIIGEIVPKAFDSLPNNEIFVRNLEGVPFTARMKDIDSADFKSQHSFLYDEEKLTAKFEGICSMLPIEYWNYGWCHRREFSQFHLEQDGGRIVKSPDWSLGKYVRTVVVRDRSADSSSSELPSEAPIVKVVDYFQGGQICHENNHLRSVEVHIQCCDGENIPNAIPSDAYTSFDQSRSSFPIAQLKRITEPELCAYQATVCTPLLCVKPPTGANQDAKSRHPSFSDIMKQINTTCLAKQEEWWTYELCFNKGVRQVRFNLEQAVTAEGNVVQKHVLANEYILGLPDFRHYLDEEALIAMTQDKVSTTSSSSSFSSSSSSSLKEGGAEEDLLSKEREMVRSFGLVSPLFRQGSNAHHKPNHLALEFSQGTACDLQQLNRSIVIEMYCGVNNVILQIREDSTCRYRMKVELTALCALPGFAPVKENVTSLVLTPLYDPETLSDGTEGIKFTTTKLRAFSSNPSSSSSSFPPPPTTNYERARQREAEERAVQAEEEYEKETPKEVLGIDPEEALHYDEVQEEVTILVEEVVESLSGEDVIEIDDDSSEREEEKIEEADEALADSPQTNDNDETHTISSDDVEDKEAVSEETKEDDVTSTASEEEAEVVAAEIVEEVFDEMLERSLEEVFVEVIEEMTEEGEPVEDKVKVYVSEKEVDAEMERVEAKFNDLLTRMEGILDEIEAKAEAEEVVEGESHPHHTRNTSDAVEVVEEEEQEKAVKDEL